MRTIMVILAGFAGLAMAAAPALASSDCAGMRANLSKAVDAVLVAARADPIDLANLSAKVDGADAALKVLADACGDQVVTASMPAATAVSGAGSVAVGSGSDREQTPKPSPSEMMERTGRTHVTVQAMPVTNAASAGATPERAAALVTDLRAAIAANDLAEIRKIAGDSAN